MTEKRKLTKEEENLCNSGLKRLESEIEYQKYQRNYAILMLTEGLEENYKFQRREFEQKKSHACHEIEELALKIVELKRQMNEGVQVKKKAEVQNGGK